MGLFTNKYPYTDFHELNLDWIIETMKNLEKSWDEYKIINALKWKGEWKVSENYPIYSIVDVNGNGYISIKNVPAGVEITNEEYWRLVANYTSLYADFQNRIIALENEDIRINEKLNTYDDKFIEVDKKLKYFIPENYGAIGDGIADDTEAIQAMFNDMDNGDQCIFRGKKYKVTDTIYINKSFTGISGGFSGYEYAPIIEYHGENELFNVTGSGCKFYNIQFSTTVSDYKSSTIGILFDFDIPSHVDCDGCIEGCTFFQFETGVKVFGRNCVIRNSTFNHCYIAIDLVKNMVALTEQRGFFIHDNEFHRIYSICLRSSLDFDGRKNIVFKNNISLFGGLLFRGKGCGVIIKNNIQYYEFDDGSDTGILILKSDNNSPCLIDGNYIYAGLTTNTDGIRLYAGGSGSIENVTISNNFLYGQTRKGIIVETGTNIVVTNNTVSNTGSQGIQMNNGSSGIVTGNNLVNSSYLIEPSAPTVVNKFNTWN